MQPIKPGALLDNQIQHISVAKVLSANVAIGQVATYDSTGTPATFSQDNGNGIMIRVAAGTNPEALPNAWVADNVDTVITHNLGRVPIGYYVCKKTASCDVYDGSVGYSAWTVSTITLRNTVGNTVDTVLYIF